MAIFGTMAKGTVFKSDLNVGEPLVANLSKLG